LTLRLSHLNRKGEETQGLLLEPATFGYSAFLFSPNTSNAHLGFFSAYASFPRHLDLSIDRKAGMAGCIATNVFVFSLRLRAFAV
jgi:hypothetical protein